MKPVLIVPALGLAGLANLPAGCGTPGLAAIAQGPRTVPPKTYVGPVPIGGLDELAARKAIRAWWETRKREPIEYRILGKPAGKASPSEFGVTIDDLTSLEKALAAEPDESGSIRIGPGFAPLKIDPAPFRKAVREKVVSRPPIVRWERGAILRKVGTPAATLDETKLFAAATNAIAGDRAVDLPVAPDPEALGLDDLKKITHVVTSFTTRYPRNPLRTQNLRLAAKELDGAVIPPGGTLSFNEAVGERTREAGYRDAVIFVEGRHEPGLAGGICQVSTTMYNAALLADLGIVRRSSHSLPVPYVPLGRDAAVYWGSKDLVVKNPFETPIALSTSLGGGRLTFRILGPDPGERKVDIVVSRRRFGREGTTSVDTYRRVLDGRTVVREESLGTSTYRPPAPPKPIVTRRSD